MNGMDIPGHSRFPSSSLYICVTSGGLPRTLGGLLVPHWVEESMGRRIGQLVLTHCLEACQPYVAQHSRTDSRNWEMQMVFVTVSKLRGPGPSIWRGRPTCTRSFAGCVRDSHRLPSARPGSTQMFRPLKV